MYKKYVVRLTDQERGQLETLVRRGRAHARKLLYARILLKADSDGPDQWTDERIAEAFEVSTATVARERRRFCEDGLEIALLPKKPGRPRRRVLDGRAEAHLIALSCSDPPEGRERWSMRLLAEKMVELGHVEALSHESVRRTLKKLAQAPSQTPVGNSSQKERGVCVEDGGGFGPLRRALRSFMAGGLLRRETLPAHRRGERPSANEAGAHRTLRRGVPARRCLLGFDELRAPERLEGGSGYRTSQETGVRSFDAAPG
jgi:transposase